MGLGGLEVPALHGQDLGGRAQIAGGHHGVGDASAGVVPANAGLEELVGKGTTFTVRLPIEGAEDAERF